VADLSSFQQVRKLAQEIATKHDRLDVLINNAGERACVRSSVANHVHAWP
jgi:NAD(P)-dependent dehydrogenase (short-subunit alcohol dehydrogenase family)